MDEDNKYSYFEQDKPTNTYGMQRELRRFAMNEYLGRQVQELDEVNSDDDVLDDDLINSNPVVSSGVHHNDDNPYMKDPNSNNDGKTNFKDKLEKSRYIKEVRSAINIDSRYRLQFEEKEVPKDAKMDNYTSVVIDTETNQKIIERYTADDLNIEWIPNEDNPIIHPFIEKNGKIYFREPRDFSPNCYQIQIPNPLHNIKSMELISSEIPNPFPTINENNNKIFIDIKSKKNNQPIKLKDNDRGLPFFLINIPIGNYEFDDLLEMLENIINKNIKNRSAQSLENMFSIDGDKTTGKIVINCNYKEEYKFHWRFWFCPDKNIPEDIFLYYMLGFAKPYERDSEGNSIYVAKLTNLFTYNNKYNNKYLYQGVDKYKHRPYRPINLFPRNYIYLMLEGQGNETTSRFGTMLDLRQPGNKLFAKIVFNNNIEFGQIAYNTFVSTINFFADVPLRKLDILKVKWVDVFGNDIDFHGLEHSFTLAFNQYLDQLTASSFSSIRGVPDPTSFTSKERIFSFNYLDPDNPSRLPF